MRNYLKMMILFAVLAGFPLRADFRKTEWLDDFHQLKKHLSKYYANLDDKITKGIDPYGLSQKTEKGKNESSFCRRALRRMRVKIGRCHFDLQSTADFVGPKIF